MTDYTSALYRLVGERIRDLRCQINLTQEELSQKVSIVSSSPTTISRTSISNIEVGRHQPPLHVLSQLSKALKTDIHFLLPTHNEVLDYLESDVLNPSNKDIIELLQEQNLPSDTEKKLENIFKAL